MTKHRQVGVGLAVAAIAVLFGMSFGCKRAPSHNEIAGAPALKATAEDLESTVVTPHLEEKIETGKNVLWCSTFQLAWNEFITINGGPINMQTAPPMVSILNKQTTTKKDIDKASYVAQCGFIEDGIIDSIKKELNDKFKGQASPNLLPLVEDLPPGFIVAYSYLFKALPFEHAFLPFEKPLEFAGEEVASFGLDAELEDYHSASYKLASQVAILNYKDNDDFVLDLETKSKGDRLILAKVAPGKTLGDTVKSVRARMPDGEPRAMQSHEKLQIPVLNFDVLKEYDSLYGKPIPPTNARIVEMQIILALQSIRFKLDRTGAVLKSEVVEVEECAAELEPKVPPAFIFDKPFLILLERDGAENPYFALWVDNAELLVPF